MLTLTRAVGERIYIGDDIVVEVRAILDGRQVRISIDAPRQVPIHRAEIFEAVSNQNRAAALGARPAAALDHLLGRVAGAAAPPARPATSAPTPRAPAAPPPAAHAPVEAGSALPPESGAGPSGSGAEPSGSEAGRERRAL